VPALAEPLLERELEIAHLQRAIDHSWHGVGRVVVIEGPAGIGKTSLVSAGRELARETGMSVRAARGSELEQRFEFGVVRQLFDQLIAEASEEQRGEWFSGAAGLARALIDPHEQVSGAWGGDSIYPRLHGLYWLCANVARARPLALFVDDAHWGDEPSLAFVGFLGRRLEELPILLVVATRPVGPGASEPLLGLSGDPDARVLQPRGLTESAARRMLVERTGRVVEERFARACHGATSGNPFLLRELARELEESAIEPVDANEREIGALAPQRVAQAVAARLRRLGPGANRLAQAIAILGDGTSLANAAALAELEEPLALEAAAAMRAADVLGRDGGLTFAHPLIRAAIYQNLRPRDHEALHASAARLLYERAAPAEQIAAQVLLSGRHAETWAVEQLTLAASSAMALGSPVGAVGYLRRALEFDAHPPDRARLLAALGRAEALAGVSGAAAHLEEAVRLFDDPDARARTAIALAELLRWTGNGLRGVEVLSAHEPVPGDERLNDRAEVEMLSAGLLSNQARERLADRFRSLRDNGPARTDRDRFELALLAFERLLANRPVAEILEPIEHAGLELRSLGGGVIRPQQATIALVALTYCDRFQDALPAIDRLIEHARRRGSAGALVVGLSMREEIFYRQGDLAGALADATEALDVAHAYAGGSQVLLQHPLATVNNVAAEQARTDGEVRELLARTIGLNDDGLNLAHVLLSRARLLFTCGEAEAARDELQALGRLPAGFGVKTPAMVPWRSQAALIMHQLGDVAAARRVAAEELELARAIGTDRAVGIALRAFALVQSGRARDILEDAVAVLERSPARLEHARALVDLGAAIRRAGERARARGPLRDGHDLAVICGASRLTERAGKEIAATGARVAPAGLRGAAALTPSERRVAELAAQGESNRAIAQTLYVTEKTVETHLGHVYDKLGVRSRRDLPNALHVGGS